MLTFPYSQIKEFQKTFWDSNLRYGQAFHQYFKLEKITIPEDKVWCDRLYECIGIDIAKNMIYERTDFLN